MIKHKFILAVLVLLLAGCAQVEPLTDYSAYFESESGNYLAFPLGDVSDYAAMSYSDRYNAIVRNDLDDDTPKSEEGNIFETMAGPSRYKKLVASDVKAMLVSGQSWNIIILTHNQGFMTSVFESLPDIPNGGTVSIEFYDQPTEAILVQAERLNLGL